jgi:hypothetical protein
MPLVEQALPMLRSAAPRPQLSPEAKASAAAKKTLAAKSRESKKIADFDAKVLKHAEKILAKSPKAKASSSRGWETVGDSSDEEAADVDSDGYPAMTKAEAEDIVSAAKLAAASKRNGSEDAAAADDAAAVGDAAAGSFDNAAAAARGAAPLCRGAASGASLKDFFGKRGRPSPVRPGEASDASEVEPFSADIQQPPKKASLEAAACEDAPGDAQRAVADEGAGQIRPLPLGGADAKARLELARTAAEARLWRSHKVASALGAETSPLASRASILRCIVDSAQVCDCLCAELALAQTSFGESNQDRALADALVLRAETAMLNLEDWTKAGDAVTPRP